MIRIIKLIEVNKIQENNHEVKHYRRKRTYNEDAFLINFKKDLKN